MERTTYMQKKRKGGFTLAEFLVVIAITTILAGVSFVTAIHYQIRLRRLEMAGAYFILRIRGKTGIVLYSVSAGR